MSSHGSIAKKVREHKALHPEAYCQFPNCLWRLTDRNGVVVSACRNHPVPKAKPFCVCGDALVDGQCVNEHCRASGLTTDDTLLDRLQRSVDATRKVDA